MDRMSDAPPPGDLDQQPTQANLDLRALARTLSHEMAAPLRAIDGFARILGEEHGPQLGAEGERMVALILSNAKRMRALVEGLVEFIQPGTGEFKPQPVDMTVQAESAMGRSRPGGAESAAQITIHPLPNAYGDPVLIFQVWTALIENALKFTARTPSPAIEVGALKQGGEDVYYIKDNGAGFDMRYAGKLFELFQRLHSIDDFEGSGVGLAIAKSIVERHGGRIWAEAEPRQGATFFFTIAPAVPLT